MRALTHTIAALRRMRRMRRVNLEIYCTCGASCLAPDVPAVVADEIMRAWDQRHSGPECEPRDPVSVRIAE